MSRPLLPRRRCPPWACKLRVSNPRREDNAINKNTMAEAASARGRVRLAGMSSRSKVASTARRIFDHQCKKAGGLKLFSASKCDPARLRSNVSWWRPDCLAGHVRFELRVMVSLNALEEREASEPHPLPTGFQTGALTPASRSPTPKSRCRRRTWRTGWTTAT